MIDARITAYNNIMDVANGITEVIMTCSAPQLLKNGVGRVFFEDFLKAMKKHVDNWFKKRDLELYIDNFNFEFILQDELYLRIEIFVTPSKTAESAYFDFFRIKMNKLDYRYFVCIFEILTKIDYSSKDKSKIRSEFNRYFFKEYTSDEFPRYQVDFGLY